MSGISFESEEREGGDGDNSIVSSKTSSHRRSPNHNDPNQHQNHKQRFTQKFSPSRLQSFSPQSSSSHTSPLHQQKSQTVASNEGLPAPIGLNGPTNFEFSPSTDSSHLMNTNNRYLTFLSSHMSSLQLHQNTTSIAGSPVRTMGIGGVPSNNEKRFCVLDLQPFYETIENKKYDTQSQTIDDDSTYRFEAISDPQLLMEHHVHPLINTSLPVNRPNDYYYNTSCNSPSSPGITNSSRSNVGSHTASIDESVILDNSAMSLEEKLRRERQRLHSHGITQFTWTLMRNTGSNKTKLSNQSKASTPSTPFTPQRHPSSNQAGDRNETIRLLIPLRGNIYIQDGVGPAVSSPLRLLYDKTMLLDYVTTCSAQNQQQLNLNGKKKMIKSVVGRDSSAIDPQLSPDGSMVAFVVAGEIYVMSCGDPYNGTNFQYRQDHESSVNDDGRNDDESSFDDMGIDSNYYDNSHNFNISKVDLSSMPSRPIRVTFGAMISETVDVEDVEMKGSLSDASDNSYLQNEKRYGRSITHGLADFVAQEEMDRYRGFWWDKESKGILFVRVDESCVPPYRITHQGKDGVAEDEVNYEDHRYPFAGENNPETTLGYIPIDRDFVFSYEKNVVNENREDNTFGTYYDSSEKSHDELNWSRVKWFTPPPDASEYLARVNWLPDGSACVQWQDRRQSTLALVKIDINTGESIILHKEHSSIWINLHYMFKVLPRAIHPNECILDNQNKVDIPDGSFSYIFASERTGYCHLYLYTYMPGDISATCVRAVTAGEWVVDKIIGVDTKNDLIYVTGTFDSPLERHLYVLPLIKNQSSKSAMGHTAVSGMRRGLTHVMNSLSTSSKSNASASNYIYPPIISKEQPDDPIRITAECGMHSIVMDECCRIFIDTCSDLTRPPSSKMFTISHKTQIEATLLCTLYDASSDIKSDNDMLPAPEILSFPTSDGTETLYAALYSPDASVHGSGPYPLICAVYGGPHVQRVNRSWNQCVDMRAQRLCSLGFAVLKCDNRGSARRGLHFEGSVKNNLGRLEVLDQVAAVRHLVLRRTADPFRVGIYGWSYGGYLSAMCLCRAPDVFHVAIAGAPVTDWGGYDTHYTERYMSLPDENSSGYNDSAVFQHVHNMRGKLMIIHGLIDENVHFRHTARLINRLISCGKEYDLLIFPDERHSPKRLRDRIYMEKRISNYFIKHLLLKQKKSNRGEVVFMGHL